MAATAATAATMVTATAAMEAATAAAMMAVATMVAAMEAATAASAAIVPAASFAATGDTRWRTAAIASTPTTSLHSSEEGTLPRPLTTPGSWIQERQIT